MWQQSIRNMCSYVYDDKLEQEHVQRISRWEINGTDFSTDI